MIYLCSASKSRSMLLDKFGIRHKQVESNYDEDQITTSIAKEFVYQASKGKLEACIKKFDLEIPILCADSVISTADGRILRKARDIDEARELLMAQSGSKISIISSLHYKSKDLLFSDISATHYDFAPFDSDDLDRYLESGEWRGKAGGCMVEGFCKRYILSSTGYESTAMGLQVERLIPWIKKYKY
ncbi:Septum formation protein Maf [hydrothermal vent metagenome]|uniref:Septum formation protein Maf n=1 Tax=hydrothermal vent metagenome TaxID=652676 RepID=A0A1W1CFI3_9ZZZZ